MRQKDWSASITSCGPVSDHLLLRSAIPLTARYLSRASRNSRRPGTTARPLKADLSPGTAEHDALRYAGTGDVGDAAHGAGEPAVVELQGAGQVGPLAAVGVVPGGGQGGQFPDGVDVAGPAVPQLIAAADVVIGETLMAKGLSG